MPAAGYAYAIDPRIIDKSLKRRLIVKAQDQKFVQCVSPIIMQTLKKAEIHLIPAKAEKLWAAYSALFAEAIASLTTRSKILRRLLVLLKIKTKLLSIETV